MKKAFTLIEVLVGALILAVTFAGLIASFTGTRGYIFRSNKRLVVANLANGQLAQLYNAVREDFAGSPLNPLSSGTHNVTPVTIDGVSYSGDYLVEEVAGKDYLKVTINMNYPSD